MEKDQERRRVYVKVNADHNVDGTIHPNCITFENGKRYEIDRVIHICRAAATRAGGTGVRYTVRILGTETFLFDEENGRWFVEAKCRG